jgi:hypothetical protein
MNIQLLRLMMIDLELALQEFNKLHTRREGTQPSYGDEAL